MDSKRIRFFEQVHQSNELNKFDNFDEDMKEEYKTWIIAKLEASIKRIRLDQQRIAEEEEQRKKEADWYY